MIGWADNPVSLRDRRNKQGLSTVSRVQQFPEDRAMCVTCHQIWASLQYTTTRGASRE
jgi:hypothetical protein